MEEKIISRPEALTPTAKQITCEYTSPCFQHSHTDWEFSIFLEGKYINQINKKDYSAIANRVFILGPNHVHSLTPMESKNRYRDIYVKADQFSAIITSMFGASLLERLSSAENPIFLIFPRKASPNCSLV